MKSADLLSRIMLKVSSDNFAGDDRQMTHIHITITNNITLNYSLSYSICSSYTNSSL